MLDSRIIASSVPKTMPPVIASTVSVSVKLMPSLNRYGSERSMTSKSNWQNIVRPQCAAAGWPQPMKPGTRDAPLEPAHAEHHDDVDEEVDHRRAR